jgi:colanic acid biosynthesis glycosyl transferase WcaI
MLRPMRILVHDYAGHPLQAQLSRELARRGHDVSHAYFAREHHRGGALERLPTDPAGLRFVGIRLGWARSRRGVIGRARHEIVYGSRIARAAARLRPDVVISANTPLLSQRLLLRAARRSGAAFVYWLQDRTSNKQVRKAQRRFGAPGKAVAPLVHWLERSALVGSQAVVAITPGFRETLADYGVADDRIAVIPNWAPLAEIVPMERRNSWAIEHGLADQLVFMYAGSLGLMHEPRLLVELAAALPDAAVVVVTEDTGANIVRAVAERCRVGNVRVLPVQPYEQLSAVLATADVLLAMIDEVGGAYSVPSKVLSYLCAGRPILVSMPPENLSAAVLAESGAGVAVEAGDLQAWRREASRLATDPARRAELGRNGRAYAERTFDIEAIGARFEEVLRIAVNVRAGKCALTTNLAATWAAWASSRTTRPPA